MEKRRTSYGQKWEVWSGGQKLASVDSEEEADEVIDEYRRQAKELQKQATK